MLDLMTELMKSTAYGRCIDYRQSNPKENRNLDDHMREAAIEAEKLGYDNVVIAAAALHDIAKPDSVLVTQHGIKTYPHHAEHGEALLRREIASIKSDPMMALRGINVKKTEVERMLFLVRHHEDYAYYRQADVPDNHPYLRVVNEETVAERILEDSIGITSPQITNELQVKHICRRAISGDNRPFYSSRLYKVPPLRPEMYIKVMGEPNEEAYKQLVQLMRVNILAQAVEYEQNGRKYTAKEKLMVADKIEEVLPESIEIVNETLDAIRYTG